MHMVVTGGAGFIGSHYVRGVLGDRWGGPEPDCVTVLDNLTYAGNLASLEPVRTDPRLRFVRGDVTDAPLVDALLAGADVVVHFAAESHVDRSIAGAAEFVTTNVVGTQTVAEAAVRHGVRLVHVSTDEVYGSTEAGSWDEEQPLRPSSPYSASKAGADLMVRAYHHTHGLDACVTRCSNNYGPYQHPEKLVPLFITNLLRGLTVPLYGDGGNVRDWLHVDDHCRGIHLVVAAGRAGEVYHIGGGTELTNKELTSRLLEAFGVGWERVRHVPDRPGHDRRYSVDVTKIRNQLGYSPRVAFDEGLAGTIDWYRTHRGWWEPFTELSSSPRR
jgi:dTDP-glucose 4,6-dehydratase